jgi:flagellar basal body-associated protein FliL
MGFLEKIEILVNRLLILLGDLIFRILLKLTPLKIQLFLKKLRVQFHLLIHWFKKLPSRIIKNAPLLINKIKQALVAYDVKGKLQQTYQNALASQGASKVAAKTSKAKIIFLAPFLIFGEWLKGLTSFQATSLMVLTAVSLLAAINIGFSGHRILSHQNQANRGPASVEDEVLYERPAYYKKEARHLELNNVRLPIFFANTNELSAVDVDFIATLSNRQSRMQLYKLELQLRDHLILNVEPMVASFPIEEEGKEILRQKLLSELNDFLKFHNIEGQVQEIKITYVLAN